MARTQRFAPYRSDRTMLNVTLERAAVQTRQLLPDSNPPTSPPFSQTQALETDDGRIVTQHIAFYDIDFYDDPASVYFTGEF